MEEILQAIGVAVIVALMLILFAGLWSFVTLWAWNLVIPYLFHLPHISLLQAFGLNLLTATFFKSSTTLTCKK